MKKFAMGVITGCVLTLTTTAFASELIQAYKFPVSYVFNQETKPLTDEYVTLNYNGHAYVPIRFIAEHTGMKIGYDEENRQILVNYGVPSEPPEPLPVHVRSKEVSFSTNQHGIFFGNIQLERVDSQTKITLQIRNDRGETGEIGGSLAFYNNKAEPISFLLVDQVLHHKGINTIQLLADEDLSSYKYVTLGLGKVDGHMIRTTYTEADLIKGSIEYLKKLNIPQEHIDRLGDKTTAIGKIIGQMDLSKQEIDELILAAISQ
ncbi:stalk domain-containing protein [Paenibacillus sp. YYML68]|uniref:stalk domain-containing protein n=1 Tax=Paenibacillus sp. YYML68 TaxID=2909250 RepID=UPI0024913318|nr:stalk domain-containing protein [Paenibacillus sp. YYML68]